MIYGHIGGFLELELLFGQIDLGNKEIHNFNGFFAHAGLDTISLGQVVEGFQHVDALLYCGNLFEGEINHVLVHHIQLLHPCFEAVVLLMPVSGLHVEDLVLLVCLELGNQFGEGTLNLHKDPHNLRRSRASENRQLVVLSLECKLQLTLTNLY